MTTPNYNSENVSPLIFFFAPIVQQSPENLKFKYENDELVEYTDTTLTPAENSADLKRYEKYAKKSARLKKFMEESPADIVYFQEGTYYK